MDKYIIATIKIGTSNNLKNQDIKKVKIGF